MVGVGIATLGGAGAVVGAGGGVGCAAIGGTVADGGVGAVGGRVGCAGAFSGAGCVASAGAIGAWVGGGWAQANRARQSEAQSAAILGRFWVCPSQNKCVPGVAMMERLSNIGNYSMCKSWAGAIISKFVGGAQLLGDRVTVPRLVGEFGMG